MGRKVTGFGLFVPSGRGGRIRPFLAQPVVGRGVGFVELDLVDQLLAFGA
jgi:hypothetical protein